MTEVDYENSRYLFWKFSFCHVTWSNL